MKLFLAILTLSFSACSVTGNRNIITTRFNINVSIVPAVEQETRP